MDRRIVLLAFCFLGTGLASATEAPSPLTRLLDGEIGRIPAKSGIYVKHLRSGEEAMVRADEHSCTVRNHEPNPAHDAANRNLR